jgi:hypothetical protein
MCHGVPYERHSITKTPKYISHHNVYNVYNVIVTTIEIIMERFMLEAI